MSEKINKSENKPGRSIEPGRGDQDGADVNIGQIFRSVLDNEIPEYKNGAWESYLRKESKHIKDRQRAKFIRRLSTAAAILAAATTLTLYLTRGDESKTNANASTKLKAEVATNYKNRSGAVAQIVSARESVYQRDVTSKREAETHQYAKNQQQSELSRTKEGELKRTKESEVNDKKESELSRTKESEVNGKKESELNRTMESALKGTKESDLNRTKEGELNRAKESEVNDKKESELNRRNEYKEPGGIKGDLNSIKEAKSGSRQRILFGVNVAPGFTNSNGKSSLNIAGGVNMEIALSRRISIATGVQLEHTNIDKRSLYASNSLLPSQELATTVTNLDIPINVIMQVAKVRRNDSRYYISAGVSTLAYLDEKQTTTYYKNTIREYDLNDKGGVPPVSNGNNFVNKGYRIETVKNSVTQDLGSAGEVDFAGRLNLMFGYSTNVSPTLRLHLEPFVKIPLSGIGYRNTYPTTTGVSCKITF